MAKKRTKAKSAPQTCKVSKKECKCVIKTTALTIGIFWAVCLFLITLASHNTGYADEFLRSIESVYPGYTISVVGSFIGLIYGFLDGFIGTYIFVCVWRCIHKKLPC